MDTQSIAQRFHLIQDRIRQANHQPTQAVTLIAVSKTQPIEAIEALYQLGHRDFGENYAQELAGKAQALEERGFTGIRWHFIGHLQTNKVKLIIPYAYSVHSVDSERLALELAKRWGSAGRVGKLPVFIEVNVDQEETKGGIKAESVPSLALKIWEIPELSLEGLMCIPAPAANGKSNRDAFIRLRELDQKCRPWTRHQLSMGMSADFELAIAEGATHVRVGTSIFGERKTV